MSPEQPAGRKSRFSEERRAEVYRATIALIAERGYQGASIDEIAIRTQTSKATLYRQWGDKSNLVLTALRAESGLAVETIDTGSLDGDLTALMDMFGARAGQNVRLVLTIADAAQRDLELHTTLVRYGMPELSGIERILSRAVERGELPADHPAIPHVPHLLIGALFGVAVIEGPEARIDAERMRGFLSDVLLPLLVPSGR
ncbi:TetR/AcrR family transcriptional regulator [Cystobacter fuscus]